MIFSDSPPPLFPGLAYSGCLGSHFAGSGPIICLKPLGVSPRGTKSTLHLCAFTGASVRPSRRRLNLSVCSPLASSRWRSHSLLGTLRTSSASRKNRAVRYGSIASKSLLSKAISPTTLLDRSPVLMPADTGYTGPEPSPPARLCSTGRSATGPRRGGRLAVGFSKLKMGHGRLGEMTRCLIAH